MNARDRYRATPRTLHEAYPESSAWAGWCFETRRQRLIRRAASVCRDGCRCIAIGIGAALLYLWITRGWHGLVEMVMR